MSESKTSKRRLEAIEKQRQALELRKAGATYDKIATTLGYKGVAGSYKAVQSAIHRILEEPAKDVIKLELERIDRLWLAVWKRATGDPPDLKAMEQALKLMKRRADLLGLDAPKRLEHSGPDGSAIPITFIEFGTTHDDEPAPELSASANGSTDHAAV